LRGDVEQYTYCTTRLPGWWKQQDKPAEPAQDEKATYYSCGWCATRFERAVKPPFFYYQGGEPCDGPYCDPVCRNAAHPDATAHSPAGIPEPDLSVGSIEASGKRYRVTNPHAHKTLVVGDIVSVVSPTPGSFYLLRHHDMSFHRLDDDHDQYVHVQEVKP